MTSKTAYKHLLAAFRREISHGDFTETDLKAVAAAIESAGTSPRRVDEALELANKVIGGFGVEAIRGDWHDRYYQDIVFLYVNTGDTYNATVVYDCVADRWYPGASWGDLVERFDKKYGIV